MTTIAMVAGEASGDTLGAALIAALREASPGVRVVGIAGPKMRGAGCEVLASSDELAVMGLAEIVSHLPRLVRLKRRLLDSFVALRPDAFVGIDSPEFNLRLARALRRRGVRTVQYVGPQVWAWRQGRARSIREACDLVLCLLPFEMEFYARAAIPARFVGHPLADQFPLVPDRVGARAQLGLADGARVVALLPGSRRAEVARLAEPFAGSAAWIAQREPGVEFVAAMASAQARTLFASALQRIAPDLPVKLVDGQAQVVLAAADAVLVASGTATLETLLSKRPMVVAYRMAPVTAALLRQLRLVKVEHFAQPNLLAHRRLVPEFFQEDARPQRLGPALLDALRMPAAQLASLQREFSEIHERLRREGARLAAGAVLEVARGQAS